MSRWIFAKRWAAMAAVVVAMLLPAMGRAEEDDGRFGRRPALGDVQVYGLDPEDEALVREEITVPLGETLTPGTLEQVRERLGKMTVGGGLQKVRLMPLPDESGDPEAPLYYALMVDFRLPPAIERVEFFPLVEGVDLEALAARFPLAPGTPFTPDTARQAQDALAQALVEQGFGHLTVIPHHAVESTDTLVLGFFLEDQTGEPAELRKVRFDDAGLGNAVRIRGFFRESETSPFDEGSSVTAARLIEVEAMTADLVRSLGYWNATARLKETETSRKKGVKVTYDIERGERFEIAEVRVAPRRVMEPEFWGQAVKPYVGRSLSTPRLRDIEERLTERAQDRGYMAPEVELDFEPVPGGDAAMIVHAAVDEGTTSVLGQVRLERDTTRRGYGTSWYHRKIAPPVREDILRKQVRIRESEQLSRKYIVDAERRLWRLGLFEDVQVETSATSDTMKRDITVKVTERRTANLGVTLGWNDHLGAVTRLRFTERNVGGRADVLSLGGYVSLQGEGGGGDISYFDRYWKLGEKLVGEEREPSMLYYFQADELGFNEYSERRVGGRLRMGYKVGDLFGPWTNEWQLRLERISYDPYRDDDDYEEDFDSYTAATVGYFLNYDTRDRGDWDSTEGVRFTTGLEAGAADGTLLKWSNSAEYHHRLSNRWAWYSGAQLGLMPFEATDVGLSDRFQAGGLGSLRGFDYRGVGPVDDEEDNLHIGGATLTGLQNEIRYVVSEDIDIPIFVDMGTLNEDPLSFGTPRLSTGLGIRIKVPGGDQRAFLYYAEQLLSEDTDDDRSLHFGFQFGL
ncbi:MAG: BamA/TamA family outer membrane protein [Sumerlaeia bacterium]